MKERNTIITMKGNPLTLLGEGIKAGDKAPDFELVDVDLKPFKFSSINKESVVIIFSVPSLDTPVCSKETHRFNQELKKFSSQAIGLTISMDLPFAQKRWCELEGSLNLKVGSDYKTKEFGERYGFLIKELHLLARACLIVDRKGTIQYVMICKEVTEEPPYEDILHHLEQLLLSNQ